MSRVLQSHFHFVAFKQRSLTEKSMAVSMPRGVWRIHVDKAVDLRSTCGRSHR